MINLIFGALLLISGIVILLVPGLGIFSMALCAGFCFLAAGIFDLVIWFKTHNQMENSSQMILMAIVDILVGVLLIWHPLASAYTFVFVIVGICVAYGICEMVNAIKVRKLGDSAWIGHAGLAIIAIIGAIVMLILGEPMLRVFIGIMVIVKGFSLLAYALTAKNY